MKVSTGVRLYVAQKREMGWNFSTIEAYLVTFSSRVGDIHLSDVTPFQIASFLDRPRTSNSTWHQNYQKLSRFFKYWQFRRQVGSLPMPPVVPRHPHTFVPYIYSREEIRRLVCDSALNRTERPCARVVDPATFRTLLLFLYGTGVLVSEALTLLEGNVDLTKDLVTLQRHKQSRTRVIPIGPDVHKVLKIYLDSPIRRQFHGGKFFLTRQGKPVAHKTLVFNFQELRLRAGVVRLDGACYQPRMHDLRSTFAVHRIASWYQEGLDAQRMLPALGAYLGQSGFVAMIRHLALTPEHFGKQMAMIGKSKSTNSSI